MSDVGNEQRCNQCGQELIEIDNREEHLIGCLTCNLWAAERQRAVDEAQRGRPPGSAPAPPRRLAISDPGPTAIGCRANDRYSAQPERKLTIIRRMESSGEASLRS